MNLEWSAQEVQELLKSDHPPRLVDVRTEGEWDIVRLEGARLLTQELVNEMSTWSPDTPIVCYCHHGIRSLDAVRYFVQQGFTNIRSLRGGIDVWAQLVDPTLPRY